MVPTRHEASLGVTHFLGLGQAEAGEGKTGRGGKTLLPLLVPHELPGMAPPLGKLPNYPPLPPLSYCCSSSTHSQLLSSQLASPLQHAPIWACQSRLVCVYSAFVSPAPAPSDHPTRSSTQGMLCGLLECSWVDSSIQW